SRVEDGLAVLVDEDDLVRCAADPVAGHAVDRNRGDRRVRADDLLEILGLERATELRQNEPDAGLAGGRQGSIGRPDQGQAPIEGPRADRGPHTGGGRKPERDAGRGRSVGDRDRVAEAHAAARWTGDGRGGGWPARP